MGGNGDATHGSGEGGQTQPPAGRKIVLVGMMGAGKTTVGGLLAGRLGCPFFDADAVIEAEAGRAIADMFREEGEAAFRRRELAVVERLLQRPGGAVIALGGGAFCQDGVRACVAGSGVSVFLRVGEEELIRRLAGSDVAARPMIAGEAWRERVRELVCLRYPLYEKADVILDIAGDESPEDTARRLAYTLAEFPC